MRIGWLPKNWSSRYVSPAGQIAWLRIRASPWLGPMAPGHGDAGSLALRHARGGGNKRGDGLADVRWQVRPSRDDAGQLGIRRRV